MKIGIPRGLMYYHYYPFWKKFFQSLGLEVVVSSKTTKKTLNEGNRFSVEDMCLPVKIYLGHVYNLLGKTDYIFLPRFISLGKADKICPKLMGLPDVAVSRMRGELPGILVPEIDLCSGLVSLRKIYHQLGKQLNKNFFSREAAFWKAYHRQLQFTQLQKQGLTVRKIFDLQQKQFPDSKGNQKSQRSDTPDSNNSLESRDGPDLSNNPDSRKNPVSKNTTASKNVPVSRDVPGDLTLAVLGHSYIINDEFLNLNIYKMLREMGVAVITQNMLKKYQVERAAKKNTTKKIYWALNRKIIGAAYFFMYERPQLVDGLLHVSSFGCGPDALTGELVELRVQKKEGVSLLNINLDEHSGRAGLKTRLEAFVDLLKRRKKNDESYLPAHG